MISRFKYGISNKCVKVLEVISGYTKEYVPTPLGVLSIIGAYMT